jgi:hypothetical protein
MIAPLQIEHKVKSTRDQLITTLLSLSVGMEGEDCKDQQTLEFRSLKMEKRMLNMLIISGRTSFENKRIIRSSITFIKT